MKRFLLILIIAVCWNGLPLSPAAQDDAAARAATIAEREAAEERYRRINTAVEGLLSAQADNHRRLTALADEIRNVRAESSRTDTSKYATREELSRLAESLREIDRKREADKKLVLEEFEGLKKDLRKMLNAPPPSTAPKKSRSPAEAEKGGETTSEKTAEKSGATNTNQEGVWYTVESGNYLNAIVVAHNEHFKSEGKKTSVKLIQDANPNLKPTSMKVGQKIFIPLVPQ